ncbi:MAG: hypothetical protein A2275_11080 [Bacteroidetes bacterium RIFOXYA12_FULL_35_11]|nr:MAG: hypothetical protein A2X01_16120 [Bacteroidetes bacterium GWF2_35_48]OFY77356.1 MAG: hypothetical protein A2275_11080 [Bacteroidetes bacterium RIFOXYA12_FULL_35_11]OFY96197.1 MAG: hypothetical protein A2309_01030 [Bacteroidetes bacterium RIFOXYB2_FULL_35_7]OFZ02975.1 MAG: hypothetical protein A2491_17800 [Bacteroidetes bacterium RIFOXYC12_FULL_35_7]HBX50906.1 hypothetical protein [Bacteroidales bacterium]
MENRFVYINFTKLSLFFKSFEKEYSECKDEILQVHICVREFKNKINVLHTWLLLSRFTAIGFGIFLIFSILFSIATVSVLSVIFIAFAVLLTNVFKELVGKREDRLEINIRIKGYKIYEIPYSFVKLSRVFDALIGLALILTLSVNLIFVIISVALFFVKFILLSINFREKLDSYYRNLMFVESFIESEYI